MDRGESALVSDLIELMERSDLPPWRREWQGQQGPHRNLCTGEAYTGSNPMLLELGSLARGHTLPLWLGAGQAKSRGWYPRKGSKSVRIVRPQVHTAQDESDRSWVSYRVVPIFNAADLNGGDTLQEAIAEAMGQIGPQERPRLEAAEAVLEAWPVPTSWGGARACYLPAEDAIRMPPANTFTSREAMVATWAHEQAHSTGHSSRLDRPMSESYAREELVAELAAVLITYRLQVGCQIENHASYLKSWVQMLREKPSTLLRVVSDARKAADLITAGGG